MLRRLTVCDYCVVIPKTNYFLRLLSICKDVSTILSLRLFAAVCTEGPCKVTEVLVGRVEKVAVGGDVQPSWSGQAGALRPCDSCFGEYRYSWSASIERVTKAQAPCNALTHSSSPVHPLLRDVQEDPGCLEVNNPTDPSIDASRSTVSLNESLCFLIVTNTNKPLKYS